MDPRVLRDPGPRHQLRSNLDAGPQGRLAQHPPAEDVRASHVHAGPSPLPLHAGASLCRHQAHLRGPGVHAGRQI